MKKLFGLAVFGVIATGCGLSPTAACKEEMNVICQRVFECYDAPTKAGANFIALFGTSQTECNSKLTSNNCATVTDSKPCQDSSKKYDGNKAAACIQDYKSASCPSVTGGTVPTGNCDNICT